MNYNNYRIKSSTGYFYLSFREEVPGATRIEVKEHGVRWHKSFANVGGVLRGISIQTPPFGGKYLRIDFQEDNETRGNITIPLFNQHDQISDWAKAVALTLPNWEIGEEYKFGLNRKAKDKNNYLYRNFYVSRANGTDTGDNLEWAFKPREDAPPLEKKPHPVTGEEKWDGTAQTKWYYDLIMKQIERLAPPAPGEDSEDTPPEDDDVQGGDFEDLPF